MKDKNKSEKNSRGGKPAAAARKKAGNPPPARTGSKKRGKRAAALIKLAIFLLFLLAVVFVAAGRLGTVAFSNAADGFRGFFAGLTPGPGYPAALKSGHIVSVDTIGSRNIVLDGDSVRVLNSSAKELLNSQHTYSDPVIDVCNGRAVVFDRSSGRYKVCSATRVLYESKVEQNILTAAIGKKGNVAIASKSAAAQSELRVFDRRNKPRFIWECESERIAAVALSANGKGAAVAVIGSKDAQLYSKLLVFDFKKNSPLAVFEYPGTALIQLEFGRDNKVLALGDNLFSVADTRQKTKKDTPFGGNVLLRAAFSEDGMAAVALSSYGSASQSNLKVFGSDGSLRFDDAVNSEIRWVSCDGRNVAVLTGSEVLCYNGNGERIGTVTDRRKSQRAMILGRKIYVLEAGTLYYFPAAGGENAD